VKLKDRLKSILSNKIQFKELTKFVDDSVSHLSSICNRVKELDHDNFSENDSTFSSKKSFS